MYIEFPTALPSSLFSFRKTFGNFMEVIQSEVSELGYVSLPTCFGFFPSPPLIIWLSSREGHLVEPRRRTAAQSSHTGLRGQTPLFYDGADKEQAGCPTIEVKPTVTKYLLVIFKEVVNERKKRATLFFSALEPSSQNRKITFLKQNKKTNKRLCHSQFNRCLLCLL